MGLPGDMSSSQVANRLTQQKDSKRNDILVQDRFPGTAVSHFG